MGRPLKYTTLEKMALTATTADGEVTLGKQVGYNRYVVETEPELKIVRLAEELKMPYDATMTLMHGDKEEPVLKITKNVFQTSTCVHPYHLDKDGKVVFDEKDVSLKTSESTDDSEDDSEDENNG